LAAPEPYRTGILKDESEKRGVSRRIEADSGRSECVVGSIGEGT
jgi:hypothetical protein